MQDEIEFGLFDRTQETLISSDNLPHWFQPNVAVFITFRTIDSLPRSALLNIEAELRDWLLRKHYPLDQSRPLPHWSDLPQVLQRGYREQKSLRWHGELDRCHGECALKNPELSIEVLNALRHFDGDRYVLDCAVIMPNHVHLLAQFQNGTICVDQCNSWLRFTATRINRLLNRKGHFWLSEAFDHLVRSPEQFQYLRRYIQNNGPNANLKVNEYRYWNRSMK